MILFPFSETGVNPYDVRLKCDPDINGNLCYHELPWIETWLNDPNHKTALGVNPKQQFQSCNLEVNRNFMLQGDGMHNSAVLMTELVNDGVRLLVYAGNAGMSQRNILSIDPKISAIQI